jgi:pimeloyl-ACP methyl ester carboxylesterase
VLLSHGIFHNREQVFSRAVFLARAGYRVLLFDLRGHGASTPAPLSGGLNEAKDFDAALRYLDGSGRVRKPVVLFGLSLSAMAALRAAAGGAQAGGVIADSPLMNGRSYVSRRTMGGFFMGWPRFFDLCLSAYNRKTGLLLRESDLDLMPVVRALDIPVLYLSGEKDDLARPADVQKLFSATRSPQKRLVFIPNAGHDQTYQKFRIGYERAVLEFLGNVRGGFPPPRKGGPSFRRIFKRK